MASERERIAELLRKLEERYRRGEISYETYMELRRKYEAKLRAPAAAPPPPAPAAPPAYAPARGIGDYFTRAWEIAKTHYVLFVPMVIAAFVSLIYSILVVGSIFAAITGFTPLGPRGPVMPGLRWIAGIAAGGIIVAVVTIVLEGWCIALVKEYMEGRVPDLSTSFSYTISRALPLVAVSLVVALAVGIGLMLCVIPGIVLAVLLALAPQAVIVDGMGVLDSIGKSFDIGKRNFFELLIILIVVIVVAAILSMIPKIGGFLATLSMAYFAAVLTLYYYDKR
ncbi:MAG: hypothetical protein DRN96_05925 [Thermoproteota archaeon]|nr:MAG: hypothetical protein DRN99_09005 [Candidatus Korarchaeota archaeon]RLG51168.1 MAG: hypothetical protein DRN96_05925 [Candidatus Korarchaeota archaeon]